VIRGYRLMAHWAVSPDGRLRCAWSVEIAEIDMATVAAYL